MSLYAEGTEVPVERSKAQIEEILRRYGATAFASGWDKQHALLQFQFRGMLVQFVVPMPAEDAKEFRTTPTGRAKRSVDGVRRAYESEVRRRWRALALVVRAKLECVSAGISTFEREFLPWVILPNGKSVGDMLIPQLEHAIKTGKMPQLLLAAPAGGGS